MSCCTLQWLKCFPPSQMFVPMWGSHPHFSSLVSWLPVQSCSLSSFSLPPFILMSHSWVYVLLPVVRDSCLFSAGVLQDLLNLKVYLFLGCIWREMYSTPTYHIAILSIPIWISHIFLRWTLILWIGNTFIVNQTKHFGDGLQIGHRNLEQEAAYLQWASPSVSGSLSQHLFPLQLSLTPFSHSSLYPPTLCPLKLHSLTIS